MRLGGNLVAMAALALACGERPRPPNVLFCISDDQSWKHVSAVGTRAVETPSFDRLAAGGVRFEHAFANAPACAPSRAAILTGRPVWTLGEGACHGSRFPTAWPTLTEILEREGYAVGHTGKGWGPGTLADGITRNPAGSEWNERKSPTPRGISDRDYAANFADFLESRNPGQPFFFWYGAHEPHRSYARGLGARQGKRIQDVDVPGFLPDTPEVRSDLLDYFAEIEWFDAQLARILATLEEAGELANTLVIVTSDNGMPFPRAKSNLYDYGSRVPLAVAWRDRIPGGRVVTDFVTLAELAPTILEAAGIRAPTTMLERSLLSVLTSHAEGRVERERDHVVLARERHTWCNPAPSIAPMRAIRTDRWLYLRNLRPEVWPAGHPQGRFNHNLLPFGEVDGSPTKWLLVEQRPAYQRLFELAFGKRPAEELYDLQGDPEQLENLAADPQQAPLLRRLRGRLDLMLTQSGDPRAIGNGAIFDDASYFGSHGVATGGLMLRDWEALPGDEQLDQRQRASERARSLGALRDAGADRKGSR